MNRLSANTFSIFSIKLKYIFLFFVCTDASLIKHHLFEHSYLISLCIFLPLYIFLHIIDWLKFSWRPFGDFLFFLRENKCSIEAWVWFGLDLGTAPTYVGDHSQLRALDHSWCSHIHLVLPSLTILCISHCSSHSGLHSFFYLLRLFF